MSQEINLFDPAFRKRWVVPSAKQVAACMGATVLVLVALQIYFQRQVTGLNRELASVQGLLGAERARLDKIKGAGAARSHDAALETDIARLETEIRLSRENVAALKSGKIGNRQGFSEFLQAFSRQSLNGLWLTGFTITGDGGIVIEGRVTNAELLPSYIQRLNQEQVLHGRGFSGLELRRPEAIVAGAGEKAKEEKPAPRYLEFSLVSTEAEAAKGAMAGEHRP